MQQAKFTLETDFLSKSSTNIILDIREGLLIFTGRAYHCRYKGMPSHRHGYHCRYKGMPPIVTGIIADMRGSSLTRGLAGRTFANWWLRHQHVFVRKLIRVRSSDKVVRSATVKKGKKCMTRDCMNWRCVIRSVYYSKFLHLVDSDNTSSEDEDPQLSRSRMKRHNCHILWLTTFLLSSLTTNYKQS